MGQVKHVRSKKVKTLVLVVEQLSSLLLQEGVCQDIAVCSTDPSGGPKPICGGGGRGVL